MMSQKSPKHGWDRLLGWVGISEPQNLATSVETSIKIDEEGYRQRNFACYCLIEIHTHIDNPLADLELVKPGPTCQRYDCAKLGDIVFENEK